MLRTIALAAVALSAAAAPAQITSYKADKPELLKGDADKMVCKKQEKIGSRLGAKKVCLTVSEWNEMALADRERTDRIQATTCMPGGAEKPCLDPSP